MSEDTAFWVTWAVMIAWAIINVYVTARNVRERSRIKVERENLIKTWGDNHSL